MKSSRSTAFIFDWDDSLFDTHELKNHIHAKAELLLPNGKELFLKVYEKARGKTKGKENVDKNFIDLTIVSEELAKEIKGDANELYQNLFLEHSFSQFLLPGTEELLSYLKDHGIERHLITQGDNYQLHKIKESGISHLFNTIVSTDNKPEFLGEKIVNYKDNGHDVWVVDDKPEILHLGHEKGARTIWIRHGKYATTSSEVPTHVQISAQNPKELLERLLPYSWAGSKTTIRSNSSNR